MRGEKKPEEIKHILEDVKKCLKNIYGKQLKGIILFGSYARGDSTEGSDIDIILRLEGIEDPVVEKEKFFDVMNIIDLTLPINDKTPTFPGDPKPEIKQVATIRVEGWND